MVVGDKIQNNHSVTNKCPTILQRKQHIVAFTGKPGERFSHGSFIQGNQYVISGEYTRIAFIFKHHPVSLFHRHFAPRFYACIGFGVVEGGFQPLDGQCF